VDSRGGAVQPDITGEARYYFIYPFCDSGPAHVTSDLIITGTVDSTGENFSGTGSVRHVDKCTGGDSQFTTEWTARRSGDLIEGQIGGYDPFRLVVQPLEEP
jgi:hypothetical protein